MELWEWSLDICKDTEMKTQIRGVQGMMTTFPFYFGCTLGAFILKHTEWLLLSEICTLGKLMLVMPATNAVSERSFSALKRVKTYLRSTTGESRLNHLMLLHVHKELADGMDMVEVANLF